MKRNTEPASARIKRLLDVLTAYAFNLYYMKAKDMTLSNFLYIRKVDKSNPHEIIPISFDFQELQENIIFIPGPDHKKQELQYKENMVMIYL